MGKRIINRLGSLIIIALVTMGSLNRQELVNVQVYQFFKSEPILIRENDVFCDQFGRVFTTWTTAEGDGENIRADTFTIWFAASDSNFAWSVPFDLLTSYTHLPSLLVSSKANIYIFFARQNAIEYVSTTFMESENIHGWTEPVILDLTSSEITFLDSVEDSKGNVHVVYSNLNGYVFHTYMDETGDWSYPTRINSTPVENTGANSVHIAVDEANRLHVVWSLDPYYQSGAYGVYYSRSNDIGRTWSIENQLAGRYNLEPNIAIIGHEEIYVVWNTNINISLRKSRWSQDGGSTWEDETIIGKAPGGILGSPGIGTDSDHTLHVLMAEDTGVLYNKRLWRGNWEEGVFLTQGNQDSRINLCISQGNQLWGLYTRYSEGELWIIRMNTGSQDIPPEPVPVSTTLDPGAGGYDSNPATMIPKEENQEYPSTGISDDSLSPIAVGFPITFSTAMVILLMVVAFGIIKIRNNQK